MNRQDNTTKIEIRGWEGGSKDDLVNFILRKTHCKLLNVYISGPVLHCSVWNDQVATLLKWSGVKFAGQSLRITSSQSAGGNQFGASPGNGGGAPVNDTITTLQTFLQSRYNAALNLLDLQNMRGDQFLISKGLFATASTSSKMFPALMKIASEKLPQVISVNLAENNLQDVAGITTLAQTYPNLQNLSLANNNISKVRNLESWRHKFRNMRELILSGNPISTLPSYKDDIMKLFPRLLVLDGVVIRDESQLDTLKLPCPIKQSFFETPDVQSVAANFVTNYFDLFDRDRSQLMPLYDESSTFSLSIDSICPRIFNPAGGSQAWSPYIPLSRNLTKTSNTAKHNRLAIGPQSILSSFNKLPTTKHDLSPDKFAIEVWRSSGVRVAGDTAIVINIHGEFNDVQPNLKRSFDRVFILINSPTGSIIVTTDMLTVRGYAGSDAWNQSKFLSSHNNNNGNVTGQNPQQVLSAGPQSSLSPSSHTSLPGAPALNRTPTPIAIPVAVPSQQPTPPIPPQLNGLSPDQISNVQKLMSETRLNPQYARMCLEQANFDLNHAMVLFQQSRLQLPPDAFQQ